MLITEKVCQDINTIVEQWKFHACNSGLFAGYINSGEKNVVIGFQEIPGNHRHSSLSPIMSHLQRRICNPNQPENKKNNYPETYIFQYCFYAHVLCTHVRDLGFISNPFLALSYVLIEFRFQILAPENYR